MIILLSVLVLRELFFLRNQRTFTCIYFYAIFFKTPVLAAAPDMQSFSFLNIPTCLLSYTPSIFNICVSCPYPYFMISRNLIPLHNILTLPFP